MPELPEVETTRCGLVPHIVGHRLADMTVRNPRLRWPIDPALPPRLRGSALHSIARRGKYLLFAFETGTMLVHLGMSGRLNLIKGNTPAGKHDHVDWLFSPGVLVRLRDPRRFGAVLWHESDVRDHPLLRDLGPEPLEREFSGEYLYRITRDLKASIKTVLMDSHKVVGVGNIYASESLFGAGIRPGIAAGRLTRPSCERLVAAVKQTLTRAIRAGGSSLRDYQNISGELGYFQMEVMVYGRAGEPCRTCRTPIRRLVQGQRASFYCPCCQR